MPDDMIMTLFGPGVMVVENAKNKTAMKISNMTSPLLVVGYSFFEQDKITINEAPTILH